MRKVLMAFIALLIIPGQGGAAPDQWLEEIPTAVHFHEHLPSASVFLIKKVESQGLYEASRMEKVYAQWTQDRFVIPEQPEAEPVLVTELTYQGIPQNAIFFPPSETGTKVMQFYEVPAGSRLLLQYGIDDRGVEEKSDALIYLGVWIGNKRITRIQAPTSGGWKSDVLDLGHLAFLKRPVTVTFEITSDSPRARRFGFLASMLE